MEYKLYVSHAIDWIDVCSYCSAPVVKWAHMYGKGAELMKWLIEYFDNEVPSLEEVDGALLAIKEEEYESILGKVG